MAETEELVILRVGTSEAVENVRALKDRIAELKAALNDEDASAEENRQTIRELTEAQNALRDVMNTSNTSIEDAKKAVDVTGKSYNELVHTLADLTKAWRTVTDETDRNTIATNIKAVNDELKALDESKGTFGRNVGNYADSIKEAMADIPPFAEKARHSLENVTKSTALLGKQPLFGLIIMITPLVQKLTENLKENGTAMDALKRAMDALKPVTEFLGSIVETIAQGLAKAVDGIVAFVGESEGMKKAVSAITGVGNVILKALVTPIKVAVEGVKGFGKILGDLFRGDFGKIGADARAAGKAIGDAFADGYSLKANYAAGVETGKRFAEGIGSKDAQAKAKASGKALGESVKEGIDPVLEQIRQDIADIIAADEGVNDALTALKENTERDAEAVKDAWAAVGAAIQRGEKATEEGAAAETKAVQLRKAAWIDYAASVSGVMGSIADMFEANGEEDERSAARAKALRIASATIDTLSGAIGAYMQAAKTYAPPAGIAIGAANAAAVTAAGMANIAKMKSTGTSASAGLSVSVPAGVSVSAPAIPAVQQTVTTQTSNDFQRLNDIAADQQVYILSSQLEADRNARQVRVAETSF